MALITQAFVLGAGLGTRLRPLTNELPKPLIPIFQKPLITFAFDHLIDTGITKFFVNTHHQPKQFAENFPEKIYRDRAIEFGYEPELLGTGGGIKNAERWLGKDPFIVYSGDILTDIDLARLIEEHFRSGNDVTLALRETGLGASVVLRDGRIAAIRKKNEPHGDYDYANVSVWNAAIFPRIPSATKISFVPILAEWIQQNGRIGGVVLGENNWFNIGTRAQYLGVHRTIAEDGWKPDYVKASDWPVWIAPDATVSRAVQLAGFYSIGAECHVGESAILEKKIFWPGAQIASRSHLRNCIVRSRQKAEGTLNDIDV